jgi:hypothetical protein
VKTTRKIAAEEYGKLTRNIQKVLKGIEAQMKKHAKEQAKFPSHWGYVGDAQHVYENLRELLVGMNLNDSDSEADIQAMIEKRLGIEE